LAVKDKLIVALDVPTVAEANKLVSELREVVGMFKVGSQLFTSAGPGLVESIIAAGNKVFLDLKFHDIPHQVAGAARSAAELGVSLFTVHASGGTEMMQRAVEAISDAAERNRITRSKVVAVSVLTSMDATSLEQIGVEGSPASAVERLVKLAKNAGVDGVVSSPEESESIRSYTGGDFLIVTPGIRPASSAQSSANEDQKRVATPASALRSGADYLVVGRPITSAPDPVAAALAIVAEMETA
jgi:orotidine 5''-phosphate decarboxylase, subfamily 1